MRKRFYLIALMLLLPLVLPAQELRYAADYTGLRSFFPDLLALNQPGGDARSKITLLPSSRVYQLVADGQTDFAAVGRGPKPGDVYEEIPVSLPIAWDAVALMTHPNNPVKNLSLTQLRDIFAGKITNWKAVGGLDRPIRAVHLKDPLESPQFHLSRFLFGRAKDSMHGEAVDTVAMAESIAESNPDALAFSFYSSARKRKVKLLAINELMPSYSSILSGQYPFFTEVYLLARPGVDRKRAGRALIKKAGSATFRRILRRIGIVPYTSASELIAHQSVRDEFLARELGYQYKL
jgi:phosphate transport system substrate-binding protein